MGMTPQHFHTIPTSCAICRHLHKYALCFVSFVQRRVVKAVGHPLSWRTVVRHDNGWRSKIVKKDTGGEWDTKIDV